MWNMKELEHVDTKARTHYSLLLVKANLESLLSFCEKCVTSQETLQFCSFFKHKKLLLYIANKMKPCKICLLPEERSNY